MSPEESAPPRLPIVADKSAPTSSAAPARGHRALRRGRASVPHRTYFITACTDERQRLFDAPEIASLVFEQLRALEAAAEIDLIASVVMADHVHAVFTLQEQATLVWAMKRFRGASAQAINRALCRNGQVWERGYFDRLLRADDRLETILHYLWHNPTPPGRHFRCRRDIWNWFRTCVQDKPEYYDWLKRNP